MQEPIIINLNIKKVPSGGYDPYSTYTLYFLNNEVYKYYEGDYQGEKYIFKVNDSPNTLNTNHEYGSSFLGRGFFNVVSEINIIQPEHLKIFLKKITLVLKIASYKKFHDEKYPLRYDIGLIIKYNEDRHLFGISRVPELFFLGKIEKETDVNKSVIMDNPLFFEEYSKYRDERTHGYSIFKKYNNINSYTSFEDRRDIFIDFLLFLTELKKNNCIIYDLKLDNLAVNDDMKVVAIDYDHNTFLHYDEQNFFNIRKKFGTGYLNPSYYQKDVWNRRSLWIGIDRHRPYIEWNTYEKYDKLMVISIIDFILKMFFKPFLDKDNNPITILYLFLTGGIVKNSIKRILFHEINYDYLTVEFRFNSHANIDNIILMTEFIYDFIEPIFEEPEHIPFYDMLKKLMYDPINNTGLICDLYENIPPYELIYDGFINNNYNMPKVIIPKKYKIVQRDTTKFNELQGILSSRLPQNNQTTELPPVQKTNGRSLEDLEKNFKATNF